MRTRARASRLAYLGLVLAASAAGCQTFEPSTPLTVHIRDAETQAPVPAATVHVWRFGSHSEERDQSIPVDADGNAHARLAPPDEHDVMVEATAPNYLPTQIILPREIADALASAKRFHPYTGPPLSVTVDVFAGPRPTVELVLPPGFRGTIKAQIRVRTDGQWPVGQRAFSYTVPSDGVVRVDGPAVFGQEAGPDVIAKFADGTPLAKDKDAKSEEVALRWVRREGTETIFVVGTNAEVEALRRTLGGGDQGRGPSAGSGSQGGGRKGGGGGGGGRGGRGGGMGR